MRSSYGSFVYMPLGLPNPNSGGSDGTSTVGASKEMEVRIVSIEISGAFARRTNPAFMFRTH
jgi:hypothetical protein